MNEPGWLKHFKTDSKWQWGAILFLFFLILLEDQTRVNTLSKVYDKMDDEINLLRKDTEFTFKMIMPSAFRGEPTGQSKKVRHQ